jgi:hypothetical protein
VVTRRRHTFFVVFALAVSLAVMSGCGESGGEGTPSSDAAERDVDRLRSLPYVSGTQAESGGSGGVVFSDDERVCPGYRLYTIAGNGRAELIDGRGDIVRSWERPDDLWMRAELLPNGDLLVLGATDFGWRKKTTANQQIADDARYVMRMNWDGEVLWKRTLLCHHDVEVAPDGRILLLTFARRRAPGIHQTLDTRDDFLTLLTQDGEVVESRSILDGVTMAPDAFPLEHVEPTDTGVVPWIDVFHANSVEWMRHERLFDEHSLYDSDHVLMCFRNQDRIAVYDWSDSRFVWSWGLDELSGPHDAQLLENGNILVFDNGLSSGRSRAVELDPRSGDVVWTYEAAPPKSFYTVGRGSGQRLPNGNTLLVESDRGRAIEVTPEGETVWEFLCPYRVGDDRRAAIVRMVHHPAPPIDALRAVLD